MDWLQNISWIGLLKCFVVGGLICVIGQILIDKTKLTPARILVAFVTTGTILGGLGIYQYLVDFAGAGATVPLTGFGYNLAKGAIKGVKESGIIGAFTGGVTASAGGVAAAVFFGYIASLISKPKMKKEYIRKPPSNNSKGENPCTYYLQLSWIYNCHSIYYLQINALYDSFGFFWR